MTSRFFYLSAFFILVNTPSLGVRNELITNFRSPFEDYLQAPGGPNWVSVPGTDGEVQVAQSIKWGSRTIQFPGGPLRVRKLVGFSLAMRARITVGENAGSHIVRLIQIVPIRGTRPSNYVYRANDFVGIATQPVFTLGNESTYGESFIYSGIRHPDPRDADNSQAAAVYAEAAHADLSTPFNTLKFQFVSPERHKMLAPQRGEDWQNAELSFGRHAQNGWPSRIAGHLSDWLISNAWAVAPQSNDLSQFVRDFQDLQKNWDEMIKASDQHVFGPTNRAYQEFKPYDALNRHFNGSFFEMSAGPTSIEGMLGQMDQSATLIEQRAQASPRARDAMRPKIAAVREKVAAVRAPLRDGVGGMTLSTEVRRNTAGASTHLGDAINSAKRAALAAKTAASSLPSTGSATKNFACGTNAIRARVGGSFRAGMLGGLIILGTAAQRALAGEPVDVGEEVLSSALPPVVDIALAPSPLGDDDIEIELGDGVSAAQFRGRMERAFGVDLGHSRAAETLFDLLVEATSGDTGELSSRDKARLARAIIQKLEERIEEEGEPGGFISEEEHRRRLQELDRFLREFVDCQSVISAARLRCVADRRPAIYRINERVTALGVGGVGPYLWDATGGQPDASAGRSFTFSTRYRRAGHYQISCTDVGRDSVNIPIEVHDALPLADIKFEGSDGPVTVPVNSYGVLSWHAVDARRCDIIQIRPTRRIISSGECTGRLLVHVIRNARYRIVTEPAGLVDDVEIRVDASSFECSDGIDNDGDGRVDYSWDRLDRDPGCAGPYDNDEGDDSPETSPSEPTPSTEQGTISPDIRAAVRSDGVNQITLGSGYATGQVTSYRATPANRSALCNIYNPFTGQQCVTFPTVGASHYFSSFVFPWD